MSTASCSSPKELTHAVPPQDAVFTLKEMVLSASPMHINSLISPLSRVAFVRNSSYKFIQFTFYVLLKICFREMKTISLCELTKLSPMAHLVTREELFVFESLGDDLGTCNDSPNSEQVFRLCQTSQNTKISKFFGPMQCLFVSFGSLL